LFAKTVRFLKRHYNVVGVDEVIGSRRGKRRLPPRALLITFDDGWSDNVDYALPILKSENVPAVLFVVADAVGRSRPFFQEELMAAWRSNRLSEGEWRTLGQAAGFARPLPGGNDLRALRELIAAVEAMAVAERNQILASLTDRLSDGTRHMVSAEELSRLRAGSVEIGLHGKTHTPMTQASDLDSELEGARASVARQMNAEPARLSTMSFPHGRWTPEIVARARLLGFDLMFTSVPALNVLDPSCPDLLGRIGVETEAVQDQRGRFRPEWLALRLFRLPARRLGQ
jgi:peptidoglycan/xylan/chitin deacetylase (PgdA/CDA1 family)